MRIVFCGLLLAAVGVAPVAAQTSSSQPASSNQNTTTETRPALPTHFGDTGLWFVPTADVLPSGRGSVSLFHASFERKEGLTDVGQFGLTAAWGLGDRFEVFGSWGVIRLHRAVRNPTFLPAIPEVGGVDSQFPYVSRGWSKTLGGPAAFGAKWSLISQSRGDAMSFAPRVVIEIPSGPFGASTNTVVTHAGIVASREFGKTVQLTSMAAAVFPQVSTDFTLSDRIEWGLGASLPTRSPLRALVEYTGNWMFNENTSVKHPPFIADDGSIAPILSPIENDAHVKLGAVWQSKRGWFVHGGMNYSMDTGSQIINGVKAHNHPWGWDVRLGWHPGVKVYVPPPPPAPEIREVIREVPAPAAPAPPAPNRSPTFNNGITANPGTVEPGQTSNLSASATDADGDTLTYTWTTTCGTFSTHERPEHDLDGAEHTGDCLLTVTARDGRGGVATSSITIPVIRREALVFEDAHFDFDKSNLKPEAIMVLDDAIMKLQANPTLNVTIEGHTDSVGTAEYNLSLGERRANAVRDYLLNRGIAASRLKTVSYGEERPKADNATAAGRAINRRASFVTMISSGWQEAEYEWGCRATAPRHPSCFG